MRPNFYYSIVRADFYIFMCRLSSINLTICYLSVQYKYQTILRTSLQIEFTPFLINSLSLMYFGNWNHVMSEQVPKNKCSSMRNNTPLGVLCFISIGFANAIVKLNQTFSTYHNRTLVMKTVFFFHFYHFITLILLR